MQIPHGESPYGMTNMANPMIPRQAGTAELCSSDSPFDFAQGRLSAAVPTWQSAYGTSNSFPASFLASMSRWACAASANGYFFPIRSVKLATGNHAEQSRGAGQ